MRRAALWLLAGLAVLAPPAAAQDRGAEPSAQELREAYPLHATPEPSVDEASARPRTVVASPTAQREPADDGGGLTVDLQALVLVALAYAGGLALAIGVRDRQQARAAAPATAPAAPTAAPPPPRPARAVPPAVDRDWTAQVEWREGDGPPRFRVVARTAGRREATPIAESAALEWPPVSPAALRELTAAAERLEAALLEAGWTPLTPGDAWYAKRFAWTARERTDRFRREHVGAGTGRGA